MAFDVGRIHIHRVEETRVPVSIDMFTRDRVLLDQHRGWLSPHFMSEDGAFDLVFQSWLFVFQGKVIVVDPCTGNGRPHKVPTFDNLSAPYIERMTSSGFRPEDVNIVVCTHLHHDHCGWNTHLRNGKWVPTFPKARYIIQKREYDRWLYDRESHSVFVDNEGVFERSVQPVLEAGLADLVDGDTQLSLGLRVEAAYGHTKGHQLLSLDDGEHKTLFTGDCFHHPIQLVDKHSAFGEAEMPAAAASVRGMLVERAAATQALLIPAHLQSPYGVRVQPIGDGFAFAPGGACD